MPPRDPRRPDRVGEAVREEVAAFLARDAKDPRILGLVTVTAVEMTRDLRHAKVFVSIMGSETERIATFDGLKSTASHLRSRVGKALQLQFAPEIAFRIDESIARAAHIETLLAGLRDPLPPADGTPDATPDGTPDATPDGTPDATPDDRDG